MNRQADFQTAAGSRWDSPVEAGALEGLRELLDHDAGAFATLVRDYLSDAGRLSVRLLAAAAAGEPGELDEASHTLRGASSHFGARRLMELCGSLELAGRTGRMSGVEAWAAEIAEELSRVRLSLELVLSKEVES